MQWKKSKAPVSTRIIYKQGCKLQLEVLSAELPIGITLTEFEIMSKYLDSTSNWNFCRQSFQLDVLSTEFEILSDLNEQKLC